MGTSTCQSNNKKKLITKSNPKHKNTSRGMNTNLLYKGGVVLEAETPREKQDKRNYHFARNETQECYMFNYFFNFPTFECGVCSWGWT